jgi:L,D-peptidoglycan transpeptidase YkuD (ErfK/YbiS/YcfS/YnhG family)
MDLVVDGDGCAAWGAQVFRAALGRAGITRRKREGDLATPQGEFLLREVLYRPDRIAIPRTRLPFRALEPEDGWCDAAEDVRYNRRVRLPYSASAEALWREDHVYDLLAPLGYNDDPVVPGRGSAIFLHVARTDFGPTAGCIAIEPEALSRLLGLLGPGSTITIRA